MSSKDYDLARCPLCKTPVAGEPFPGYHCNGEGCRSFLFVVIRGQKKGDLKWHHPLECEEDGDACLMCNLYS